MICIHKEELFVRSISVLIFLQSNFKSCTEIKNDAFIWYVYVENFVVYTSPWHFQLSYRELCYNMRFQLQNEFFL